MSSSSSSGPEEKKRKRMVLNRESARRSRMKKQKHINDLVREKDFLEKAIPEIAKEHDALARRCRDLELRNDILRAQKTQLADYFEFLSYLAAEDDGRGTAEPIVSAAALYGN